MVPYQQVFLELSKRKIEYIVAGGFALNFHQVQRATVDLDLILRINKENLELFVKMMNDLGFSPRIPVKAEEFCNAEKRQKWIEEKGMMVFSFANKTNAV